MATRAELAFKVSPAKVSNPALKSWKLIYHLILFCRFRVCQFLRSDLTKSTYSIVLEETRTIVVESVLCSQAGPGNDVDEGFSSEASAAPQPMRVLVAKSIACAHATPLVLLLHSKAEKNHPSSLL